MQGDFMQLTVSDNIALLNYELVWRQSEKGWEDSVCFNNQECCLGNQTFSGLCRDAQFSSH